MEHSFIENILKYSSVKIGYVNIWRYMNYDFKFIDKYFLLIFYVR